MASTIKSLLLLVIIGYLVSVFVFAWDPVGLILKKEAESAARENAAVVGPARSSEEVIILAKRWVTPGTPLEEIEYRFGTQGELLGSVYRSTLIIGETKYYQYRLPLDFNVVAYVLCETLARKVAGCPNPIKFDGPF